MGSDRAIRGQIRILNVAAREQEAAVFAVGREFRHAQVVHRTFTTRQPFRVERGDNRGINLVNLLNKVTQLVDEGLDVHQALKVQHAQTVEVDWVSDPTYRQVLNVRRFTAQQRHDAVSVTLALQRLQVVRYRNQVHFRRQFHRRVTPVAIGENTQLTAGNQIFDLVLNFGELFRAVQVPGRNTFQHFGGFGWIGLQCRSDVHPVQRRKLIEMNNMVMRGVRSQNDVTDVLRVNRNVDIQRTFCRTNGRQRVSGCTYATDTLHNHPCIARIAVFHDLFHAAPHGTGSPCFRNDAIFDFAIDA